MKYLLGLDAGTSSFKAALFDEEGKIITSYSEDYSLTVPAPSIVEFCPEAYWNICKNVLTRIVKNINSAAVDIKAMAISSQGETLICLDRDGKPLRNAIVWLDNRSDAEADILREKFGVQKVYEVTGQSEVVATWPATKILWLRKNEPEVFNKTYKFLLLEDYLIYRLTGRYAAEKSLLCSSLLFDIHRGCWWEEMLDYLHIRPEQLPQINESGTVVGSLTEEAGKETGLAKGTLVVTGALDQTAGLIGAGNLKPGAVLETTGSCLAVCANIRKPIPYHPALKLTCQAHAIPGRYYLLFWAQTAGIVLKWFKENFYKLEEEQAAAAGKSIFQIMDQEAMNVPAGSEGLLMLPHLSGAACPEYNPYARGVFSGFTLMHTRPHFVRAAMESVAYMINRYIKILEELGIFVDEIHSFGGGSRSKLWNSIKADVTGKTFATVKSEENTCLGAAILAGAGSGIFSSIESACSRLVEIHTKFEPDPNHLEVYLKGYDSYLKLYKSLENMFVSKTQASV